MREIITPTTNLTDQEARDMNRLAAAGFEQSEDDMLEDTTSHIVGAEEMQLLYDDNERMSAFALYRGCLWRASDRIIGHYC